MRVGLQVSGVEYERILLVHHTAFEIVTYLLDTSQVPKPVARHDLVELLADRQAGQPSRGQFVCLFQRIAAQEVAGAC